MEKSEAEKFLSKKIRLILTNNFHFSGVVISVSDDSLMLKDKFQNNVTIKLENIMILEEIR